MDGDAIIKPADKLSISQVLDFDQQICQKPSKIICLLDFIRLKNILPRTMYFNMAPSSEAKSSKRYAMRIIDILLLLPFIVIFLAGGATSTVLSDGTRRK